MLEGWPLLAAAFVFGLLVGSFLNVVILRLPARLMHDWRRQSLDLLEIADEAVADPTPPGIVYESSHCPHCKHRLAAADNIPLLSWLMLGGKCRYCGTRISAQYPFIEALTAVASMIVVWKFGPTMHAALGLLLTFALIALTGIDARTQLLPDDITLPLLWIGLLTSLVPVFVGPGDAIIGAAVGYLSLWSVYWLFKLSTGKEGMGYGDFKLLAALGAWMGWMSLLPIVLISSLIGAIVGSLILLARGKSASTPIPFGPFIAGAGWVQFVWSDQIASLYERVLSLYGVA
jgi:leader peptidase (prepilin peptidase)/N-methyltransferase